MSSDLKGVRAFAHRVWGWLCRPFQREAPKPPPPAPSTRLTHVVLTDEVADTLLREFAEHRESSRGGEEIGWLLLGHRESDHAIVRATIPAGTFREASITHVAFDSEAQEATSLILRQEDKRLKVLGVVHTHPGELDHPSSGDYRGDSVWVESLPGQEGIFAIGVVDGKPVTEIASESKVCVQCRGDLRFCWYALAVGDENYRPLRVEQQSGADLALTYRPVQSILEEQAIPLKRLLIQQAQAKCRVVNDALSVKFRLADDHFLILMLRDETVEYYVIQGEQTFQVSPDASSIEEGVYLLLAELARQAG